MKCFLCNLSIGVVFNKKRRSALAAGVPPHRRPKRCSSTFSASPPMASSSLAVAYLLRSTGFGSSMKREGVEGMAGVEGAETTGVTDTEAEVDVVTVVSSCVLWVGEVVVVLVVVVVVVVVVAETVGGVDEDVVVIVEEGVVVVDEGGDFLSFFSFTSGSDSSSEKSSKSSQTWRLFKGPVVSSSSVRFLEVNNTEDFFASSIPLSMADDMDSLISSLSCVYLASSNLC